MCLPIPTGTKNFFCRFHFGVLPVGSRQEERGFFPAWRHFVHKMEWTTSVIEI
ncbi:uncharacterized protein LOC144174301 [Haemaphysalis longicornis]